jgi:hypothetical protein
MKKLLVCSFAIAMVLGLMLAPAQAQDGPYIDDGGIGDLLLFSLYDVRADLDVASDDDQSNWQNFLAIENTSGAWTAFHLRFRAWKKSIEVWDHVILLSPFDVFWMKLARTPGGVEMYSGDTETLFNSGLIYSLTKGDGSPNDWTEKFSGELLEKNGFCQIEDTDLKNICLEDQLRTGYIEAIGMFQLEIPQSMCPLIPDDEDCLEDTHDLRNVVSDVNKYVELETQTNIINVYDVLDALFFAYVENKYGATGYYIGNITAALQVFAAWPNYEPVSIGGDFSDTDATIGQNAELPSGYQSDFYVRAGLDCKNHLTGVLFFTDLATGRFQMENFIALRNFRTTYANTKFLTPFYSYFEPITAGDCSSGVKSLVGPDTTVSNGDCVTFDQGGNWAHRDGYWGGIFYPAATQAWFYGFQNGPDYNQDWFFAGGSEDTFLWYYVQPNITTTAGPTLVDGDDRQGTNWNDLYVDNVNGGGPYLIQGNTRPVRDYGWTLPLGAEGPNDTLPGYFVHYFNDIWSLDDVEIALQKADIWSTYWTTVKDEDGADITTNADLVLTYPTKHNHWFFADWPFMWKFAQAKTDGIDSDDWNQYIANVYNYLGDFEPALNQPGWGYVGKKSIEALTAPDLNTLNKFNTGNWSYAEWFQDHSSLQNGRLYADALIWDMNQVLCGTPYNGNPPPSPWAPETTDFPIPHEVNVIRVGYSYGLSGSDIDHTKVGLGEGNPLLECAGKEVGGVHPWRKGHFRLSQSLLKVGQRSIWMDLELLDDAENISVGLDAQGKKGFHSKWTSIYASSGNGYYYLPPIGLVVQGNEKADADAGTFSVSNKAGMAEWHYMELKQDYKDGIGR